MKSEFRIIRRVFVCLTGLMLLCGVVTGCSEEPSVTHSEPTEKKQDLTGRHVNFLISWTQLGAAERLAQWFNEETGAVVRIMKVDYHDLYDVTIQDFTSPEPQIDVMMLWYVHLGRLVSQGILENLERFYIDYEKQVQATDYIPHFFDRYTLYKGRRWAVPFDGDIHVLFYRKSIFEKYALSPPRTWEEYTKIAELITQKESVNGIYGSAIMAHPTPILIVSSFMNRIGGSGRLMETDQTPLVNSPAAVKALELMVNQCRSALPHPIETDFAVARDAFLQGQVAMVEQWTDIGIMAENNLQSLIKGDWDVVPIPVFKGARNQYTASLNAGWALGLSNKAVNPDVAKAFLAFITRPDITLRLNLIPGGGGIDPIRKSVVFSDAFRKFAPRVSRIEEQLLNSQTNYWPNHPAMPDLLDSLSKAIVSALEGRETPRQALDKCQSRWRTIIENTSAN